MNKHLTPPDVSEALAGMTGRRWTVAELEAMTRKGIIREKERFELLHGEIRLMNPKGIHHEVLKTALTYFFIEKFPKTIRLGTETTFRLTANTFIEPDFLFYLSSVSLAGLRPSDALFAVEVADSSLGYDRGRKARIYSTFGIPELWVINAVKQVIHVFREPGADGYLEKFDVPPDRKLSPLCAPKVSLKLGKLDMLF